MFILRFFFISKFHFAYNHFSSIHSQRESSTYRFFIFLYYTHLSSFSYRIYILISYRIEMMGRQNMERGYRFIFPTRLHNFFFVQVCFFFFFYALQTFIFLNYPEIYVLIAYKIYMSVSTVCAAVYILFPSRWSLICAVFSYDRLCCFPRLFFFQFQKHLFLIIAFCGYYRDRNRPDSVVCDSRIIEFLRR